MVHHNDVAEIAGSARDRVGLWTRMLTDGDVRVMAEVGVQRGIFAAALLEACRGVSRYYMIDPWRHLEQWNKPANTLEEVHERYYADTIRVTERFAAARVVLRGTTREVIDRIADGELDFAYIDGDHTLRGITIDLALVWPKIRYGGCLGGDDFCASIWQHDLHFEPTLVFPYAVHFAEAHAARIYALPFSQFLIEKTAASRFEFIDLVGSYSKRGLQDQWAGMPHARTSLRGRAASAASRVARRLGFR